MTLHPKWKMLVTRHSLSGKRSYSRGLARNFNLIIGAIPGFSSIPVMVTFGNF